MPSFIYSARSLAGEEISGELSSMNLASARDILDERGLFPIKLEEKTELTAKKSLFSFERAPQAKEIANLTRQFEVMVTAGMQVDKAIGVLANQTEHSGLKAALLKIQDDVAGGTRLSEAFKKHPKYFNSLYSNMIEMGQAGGILGHTLKEVAKILQKEDNIRSKISSATMYPKIVAFTLFGVIWAMLAFVFPAFMDFYAGLGAELPLPTRIMIKASNIVTSYWYIPVILIGLGVYAWRKFKETEQGRNWIGVIAFKLPVFGHLNSLVANSRFGHLTAALYRSGVSLPQALLVVSGTVNNVVFSNEVLKLKEGIEEGHSLSECMKNTSYFYPMVREACAVGEQTGRLDIILESTAQFYDQEIEEMISNLSTLIEPMMIFVLFGAVLLLALAVYMPIWNMAKAVL